MASKLALLQMTSTADPATNAATLVAAAHTAAEGGAVMLFAPEMSALVDRDRDRARRHIVAEEDNPFVRAAIEAARTASIWIHLGSVPVLNDADASSPWRNRSIVIDDQGNIRARYDKLHLFDVDLPSGERWRESSAYEAGDRSVIVTTPIGRVGLTICYDLRFGALYDRLGEAGAEVIAVPAAFTVPTGEAHWHILLRARAIEQGCFIVAAAQTGSHEDGRTTFGHSMVVAPWGEVIADMDQTPGLALVDIELDDVARTRNRIAAIRHRRPIPAVQIVD